MPYLWMLMIGFMAAGPTFAADSRFVTWWERYDEQIIMNDYSTGAQYRKKEELRFDSLPEYRGQLSKPAKLETTIGRTFILYSQKNYTILLVTPENTMENRTTLDEQYKQTIKKCARDHSWIVTLPANAWTAVELNPYCEMDYDTEGIKIDLYWTRSSTRPFIDFVTNSLACVPHVLFGWSKEEQRYRFAAKKCTGNKIVESFPLSGSQLHQVF